jgi:hypothetical protein
MYYMPGSMQYAFYQRRKYGYEKKIVLFDFLLLYILKLQVTTTVKIRSHSNVTFVNTQLNTVSVIYIICILIYFNSTLTTTSFPCCQRDRFFTLSIHQVEKSSCSCFCFGFGCGLSDAP